MTGMRKAFALGLAAVMVLALGAGWSAPAQEDARTKLLGVWKGMFKFGATAPVVMEFFEDHGVLRWKCSHPLETAPLNHHKYTSVPSSPANTDRLLVPARGSGLLGRPAAESGRLRHEDGDPRGATTAVGG